MLKDFALVRQILKGVRRAVKVPVTVKTRSGWRPGQGEILDLIPILVDCGVDGVTLHPRWGIQGFSGEADWELITRLVDRFPGPVIGNGDVKQASDVPLMLEETGCAGVMIGRGAMGNPWIFNEALALLQGRVLSRPEVKVRLDMAARHAEMLLEHFGLPKAVYMLRGVFMWYTRGLPNSAAFRGRINQVRDFDLLIHHLHEYMAQLARLETSEAKVA